MLLLLVGKGPHTTSGGGGLSNPKPPPLQKTLITLVLKSVKLLNKTKYKLSNVFRQIMTPANIKGQYLTIQNYQCISCDSNLKVNFIGETYIRSHRCLDLSKTKET